MTLILCLCLAASGLASQAAALAAGSLLVEPSFEEWPKGWTRGGTHPGSAHWDSRWIGRTDGRTGPGFMVAVKHPKLEPFDDTTPVDVSFLQNVPSFSPGAYEASLWLKVGGEGALWDGPGGADQWTQLVVYLWADAARSRLVRVVSSPRIEVPVPEWRRISARFTVPPAGVKSLSFYAYARLVDRHPKAWVAWDDAYLGPGGDGDKPAPPANLLRRGDFEGPEPHTLAAFQTEGDASRIHLDQGTGREGDASLRIDHPSIGSAYLCQTIPLDCKESTRRVRASVWCRVQGVVRGEQPWYGARMIVWLLDGEGKVRQGDGPSVHDIVPYLTGTAGWRRFERTLVIPRGVSALRVQIGVDHASGATWFDEARVDEVFDDYLVDEEKTARIQVDARKVTSTMLEGFGWNWETVTPDRYYASELAAWPDLFRQMAWDGPELLRVPVSPGMCPPKGYVRGEDKGQRYTFDFSTAPLASLCRLLEFCDAHDIHVLLANWHAGTNEHPGIANSLWLQKGFHDGTADKAADWLAPYSRARMADYLADLVHYLCVTRGFQCIRYASVWNEPGYWVRIGQYPDGILEVYRLLDARLRARGIRSRVKLLGLEMVEGGEAVQKTVDVLRRAPFIDVAAVHDYGGGLPVATATTSSWLPDESVRGISPRVRALRGMRPGGVPLLMTETNGAGTNLICGEREQFLACLGAAEYGIELVKAGLGGILKWQYNQPGACQFSPFRLQDWHAVPNRATYYPWAMLHRWSVRGSAVLETRVGGGLDANGKRRVRAVALRAPTGQVTLLVTNDGRLPKTATLRFSGPAPRAWRHFYYDGALSESVREGAVPEVAAGSLRVVLPPESVNVVTSFQTGLTGDAPRCP